jgi:hypothetical protein
MKRVNFPFCISFFPSSNGANTFPLLIQFSFAVYYFLAFGVVVEIIKDYKGFRPEPVLRNIVSSHIAVRKPRLLYSSPVIT